MCAFTDALKTQAEINKSTPQNAAREIRTKRHTGTVLVCFFVRLCWAVLGANPGPSNDGGGQHYHASNGRNVCVEACDASQSRRTPPCHTCLPRTLFDSKLTPLSKTCAGSFPNGLILVASGSGRTTAFHTAASKIHVVETIEAPTRQLSQHRRQVPYTMNLAV